MQVDQVSIVSEQRVLYMLLELVRSKKRADQPDESWKLHLPLARPTTDKSSKNDGQPQCSQGTVQNHSLLGPACPGVLIR